MNNHSTREKLVQTIIDFYVSATSVKKLTVANVAAGADISRQAFHRYHSDLKDYITGKKPISDLIIRSSGETAAALLSKNIEYTRHLENTIKQLKIQHELEREDILNRHTSFLMNNDISAFSATEIQKELDKQILLSDKYNNKIRELTLQLAGQRMTSETTSIKATEPTEATIIDFNFAKCDIAYSKDKNFDAFEDCKASELSNTMKTLQKFNIGSAHLIFFIEKYLMSFSQFCESLTNLQHSNLIIVRTPIFSNIEFKTLILNKISNPECRISLAIPYCALTTEIQTHRKFFIRHIPDEEFQAADNCEQFRFEKNIYDITYINASKLESS